MRIKSRSIPTRVQTEKWLEDGRKALKAYVVICMLAWLWGMTFVGTRNLCKIPIC